MGFISQIKDMVKKGETVEEEFIDGPQEEYVELGGDHDSNLNSKILITPFTLNDFEDIKDVIDALRTGNCVALINIRPLKEKEITELKRAVAKLKKTCDAIGGDIAGFSEDWLVVAPSFESIYRDQRSFASSKRSDDDEFDEDF